MTFLSLILIALLTVGLVAILFYGLLFRYVPIIERNAFDVPRHQVPADIEPTTKSDIKELKIPFDTRNAIEAQYISSGSSSKKLVVFCHETGADLNSWYKHAFFLPDEGIDVLSFNFKPYSLTDQRQQYDNQHYQWPSSRDLRCLERVLSWVAVEKKGYEVALFGVSKGATVAAAAAPSPLIKSVLLDGAFSTHLTLQAYMKKWVNIYVSPRKIADGVPNWVYIALSYITLVYAGFKKNLRFFSVEKFISKLQKPVFMIHAGKDYHVRLEHVERLRKLIPGMTDLWVAEKAGHSEAVLRYPKEYNDKITNFFNKTLGQASQAVSGKELSQSRRV